MERCKPRSLPGRCGVLVQLEPTEKLRQAEIPSPRANGAQQDALIMFLNSLLLFPPDDTASNLDPGDPGKPSFPQFGHGRIKLTVLFDDPIDPE
jgi:hypothetical protein